MNSLLLALGAIITWSTVALLGSSVADIPAFLVLGLVFSVGGIYSLIQRGGWRVSPQTLLVGLLGIFVYHFLYFRALAIAPAVDASLINYLWPLLIVLLSPVFLPGYHLGIQHLAGGLLGLAGAVLIISKGHFSLDMQYLPGYLLAAAAAVTWAVYSLLTKKLPPFPTSTVGPFCLISSLLSFAVHFASGGTLHDIAVLTVKQWLMLAALGIGPLGAAFFLWDAAIKRGDPRRIGALSYLTPLLSTLTLVVVGGQRLTWVSIMAMVLIVSGAVIGNSSTRPRPALGSNPQSRKLP
jgi:drug/metabolite transporter (DMT)-like permease